MLIKCTIFNQFWHFWNTTKNNNPGTLWFYWVPGFFYFLLSIYFPSLNLLPVALFLTLATSAWRSANCYHIKFYSALNTFLFYSSSSTKAHFAGWANCSRRCVARLKRTATHNTYCIANRNCWLRCSAFFAVFFVALQSKPFAALWTTLSLVR